MSVPDHSVQPQRLEITDAQPSHEPLIREISDQTHATHRARLPHRFGPENDYQHYLIDTVFGRQTHSSSDFHCLMRVACRAGVPLGYAIAVWHTAKTATDDTCAVVADIGVHEAARRQGVASALLADLQAQKDARGWHSITAQVWHGNTASHALFAAAGFVPEQTEYLHGTPPPLEADARPTGFSKRHLWWIGIAFLLAIALVASVP